MKSVVISAALIASVLETAPRVAEAGMPWAFDLGLSGFGTVQEVDGQRLQGSRLTQYTGVTVMPWGPLWAHLGASSRLHAVPGASASLPEPLNLHGACGFPLWRGWLNGSLAFSRPVAPGSLPLSDSAALARFYDRPSPFPGGDVLPAGFFQAGLFAAHAFEYTWVSAYATVTRKAPYAPFPDSLRPAQTSSGLGCRAIRGDGGARHEFEAYMGFFGAENDARGLAAHREGDLWRLRYGYARAGEDGEWALAGGVAIRRPDRNRPNKLPVDLEPVARNDNIQRAFAEWRMSTPGHAARWDFGLQGSSLYSATGGWGVETMATLIRKISMGRRLKVTVSAEALCSTFDGTADYGAGLGLRLRLRERAPVGAGSAGPRGFE